MRSAIAAARASCVTITVVCPYVSTESRISARISPPVAESRFPVGSSAKSTVGLETSARAIATRCCWPPESSEGRWWRRSARPTFSIRPRKNSGSAFSPAIESGRTMFSSAVSIGSRLKNWKTNPMCVRRSLVRSESFSVVISVPETATVPVRRLVEPGEDVHQRRLAGARRPHDRGQIALRHLERDAAQRVDCSVAFAVPARDVVGRRRPRPSFRSPSRPPWTVAATLPVDQSRNRAVNHTFTLSPAP